MKRLFRTLLPLVLIAFVSVAATAGCGDEADEESSSNSSEQDHPYYDQCRTSCKSDVEECEDEVDECIDTCLARTEALEGTCATCVSENFEVGSDVGVGGDEEEPSCFVEEGRVSDCDDYCQE